MSEKELTFDQALESLEKIVEKLERGDVPLEQALEQFQEGIKLSQYCMKTLKNAEETMTKIVNEHGEEIAFEGETETNENAE